MPFGQMLSGSMGSTGRGSFTKRTRGRGTRKWSILGRTTHLVNRFKRKQRSKLKRGIF